MKKKNNDTIKLLPIIVFSFVIGGIITLSILRWTPILDQVIGNRNTVITKNGTQIYEKSSLAASVEKVYDAVVVVEGYQRDQLASTGTGFVYKTDDKYGYLLTNQHVISGQEKINVLFTNGKEVETELLGSDEYLDLAVLRIPKKYVTLVATIGKSEDMSLGDAIFTVGSPLGSDYYGSVTSGILSGKDRMVSVAVSNSRSNDWVMRVLQIDASINPGNSGGPLLNVNGEVIGICSMKLVDDEIEGMGFAIPIEYAMNHAESLENNKKIEWPVLGISMVNVTDIATLRQYNISVDKDITYGAVVLETSKDSGAEKAGLKKGDVIIKVNDTKIKDHAYLRYELYQHQAGDTINVTYIRDGKEHTTKVTLTKS
ncbi:MAG: trypsin-like peptidase domain-containing protein [Tenericutes bacterium]|nr:trypsin-like peptidase domain-containing protein [Mycoplasmatota bacterium]MDD6941623.1 trypsin-like peptidase domain-containing protein [bacterium]MDY2697516.1 trypsin-like peptidase domain-containing protein [Bacilli bacterium]